MVAIINPGSSLRRAFQYNENKVKEGVATCLMAENYPFGLNEANEEMKLKMLSELAGLRPDVEVNSVHISLNFAPDEMLSDDRMREIAKVYMDRIGFGNQPFLVYRHHDSGHPHCHIVTTNIEMDSNRISLHHLGRLKSEPVRKEIERQFNLVRAEDHKKQLFILQPVNAEKIQYGKTETKRAIGLVLEIVLNKYKYASLPELNAILSLYNVSAERGSEGSRTYRNRGLVYRVLDTDGQPVGVPVKASLFHNRPTLEYLEKQFLRNDVARQEHKGKVKSMIDFTLKSRRPKTFESLDEALKNSGIRMVLRRSKEGLVYGITYVDLKTKCVFNGSALGKNYSAKGMQERMESSILPTMTKPGISVDTPENPLKRNLDKAKNTTDDTTGNHPFKASDPAHEKSLLEQLMQHEYAAQQVPFNWRRKKRKRKKKR